MGGRERMQKNEVQERKGKGKEGGKVREGFHKRGCGGGKKGGGVTGERGGTGGDGVAEQCQGGGL